MNISTLNEENIEIESENGPLEFDLKTEPSNLEVVCRPTEGLEYYQTYTVTVKSSVQDSFDHRMADDYVFEFRTEEYQGENGGTDASPNDGEFPIVFAIILSLVVMIIIIGLIILLIRRKKEVKIPPDQKNEGQKDNTGQLVKHEGQLPEGNNIPNGNINPAISNSPNHEEKVKPYNIP